MIKNYETNGFEPLLKRVVDAVKNGEEYVPNSARQRGNRFSFQMEDGKEVKNVESVSVIDNGSTEEEFEEALSGSQVSAQTFDPESATKAEIIEKLDGVVEADKSMRKDELVDLYKETFSE